MRRSAKVGKTRKKPPVKIVLDTNVFISGFLSPQNPPGRIILYLTEPGLLKLIISDEIFDEYKNVMKRKKFNMERAKINYALRLIQEIAITVNPKKKLTIVQDVADNKFFECALEGKAEYIITGDIKHIQKLKEYKNIKIVSPSGFLTILEH